MSKEIVIEGEDAPIQVKYLDDSGNPVAPDGVSGGTGPTITITAPDDTEVASAVVMTELEVGTYEYIYDSADVSGTGTYHISVTAELSAETKIVTGVFEVV